MKLSLLSVVTAAAVGALAATASIVPAQASDDVVVKVVVVDAKGAPLAGIDVDLVATDQTFVPLGQTDDAGTLETSTYVDFDGETRPIPAQKGTVEVSDPSQARQKAGSTYLRAERAVDLKSGRNDLGSIRMERSSRLTGKVTAPSGRPIRNVLVQLRRGTFDYIFSNSASDGSVSFGNLRKATYQLERTRGATDDEFPSVRLDPVTVKGYDLDLRTTKLANTRVTCETKTFAVSSPRRGQVTLSVRASAPLSGLTDPRGTIVVKRGSTTVKTFTVRTGKTITATVKGQPVGRKTSYTATYSKGDCLTWNASRSVTVKK